MTFRVVQWDWGGKYFTSTKSTGWPWQFDARFCSLQFGISSSLPIFHAISAQFSPVLAALGRQMNRRLRNLVSNYHGHPVLIFLPQNGFLKRLPHNERKSSALSKLLKSDRFWAVFSVHDEVHPFLELWNEPTEVASKPPQYVFPLAVCQHIRSGHITTASLLCNLWFQFCQFVYRVAQLVEDKLLLTLK